MVEAVDHKTTWVLGQRRSQVRTMRVTTRRSFLTMVEEDRKSMKGLCTEITRGEGEGICEEVRCEGDDRCDEDRALREFIKAMVENLPL